LLQRGPIFLMERSTRKFHSTPLASAERIRLLLPTKAAPSARRF
jgi:hypothetical protein